MARAPRNLTDARGLLTQADTGTAEGREQVRAVLAWLDGQDDVPADMQRRAAEARRNLALTSAGDESDPVGDAAVAVGKWVWENFTGGLQVFGEDVADLGRVVIELGKRRDLASAVDNREELERILEDLDPVLEPIRRRAQERRERRSGQASAEGRSRPDPAFAAREQRLFEQAAARPERGPEAPETSAEVSARRQDFINMLLATNPEMTREQAESAADAAAERGAFDEEGLPPLGVHPDHEMPGDTFTRGQFPGFEDQTFPRFDPTPEARRPLYTEDHASGMQSPMRWSVERITTMQKRLVEAGLLQGDFRSGWFDGPTQDAWRQAIISANQRAVDVWDALDVLATQRQEDVEQFVPSLGRDFLPPDPAALRQQARSSLISMGRRSTEISPDEIDQMVSVMTGEYKQRRDVEIERQRREHEAAVSAVPGEQTIPDMSDLQQVNPTARFDDWFQKHYAGEIETRETGQEVARRGQLFDRGVAQMGAQVRGGGA